MMFNGLRVISSHYLVEDGPLTVSWQPCGRSGWKVKRMVIPKIPYRGAVHLNATTLVMHPETIRLLREQTEASDARLTDSETGKAMGSAIHSSSSSTLILPCPRTETKEP